MRPAAAIRSLRHRLHNSRSPTSAPSNLQPIRARMTSSYPSSPDRPSAALAGKPKIVVIAGPTGVGKSKLSLLLAARLNGEVVSADSVQLYRTLDIGSNKLPVAQRAGIPHHCIDCAELTADLTVADWHALATAAIADITARDKLPIVTGGTMLYLRWLLYGQPLQVTTAKHSRQQADDWLADPAPWAAKVGRLQLSAEALSYLDGVRAMNCSQRLSRAVEIVMLSNKPPPPLAVPGRDSLPAALQFDARCVLLTADRTWLCRQLDYRCEEMLEQGLIEETYLLSRNGALQASTQAASIGYRQVLDFLAIPNPSVSDFHELLSTFQGATRRYVRRQLTFFRTEDVYRFLTIATPTVPEDRKKQLAALPHPSTFQLSDASFDELTERVAGYVDTETDQYWDDLCRNETTVQQQQQARDSTKEQPKSAQHTHTQHTAHGSLYGILARLGWLLTAVLGRLSRLREADHAAAAAAAAARDGKAESDTDGAVEVSDEVKELDEKKAKLLADAG